MPQLSQSTPHDPPEVPLNIIAIDPGIETGYAIGSVDDNKLTLVKHGWSPWKAFVLAFHERMMEDPYDVVVYESWLLQASKAKQMIGSDMQSSQAIGAIHLSTWLAMRAGHKVKLVTQHPAHKTPANAWIQKLGLYLPTSEVEHNRDGIRHLYYYCIKEGIECQ